MSGDPAHMRLLQLLDNTGPVPSPYGSHLSAKRNQSIQVARCLQFNLSRRDQWLYLFEQRLRVRGQRPHLRYITSTRFGSAVAVDKLSPEILNSLDKPGVILHQLQVEGCPRCQRCFSQYLLTKAVYGDDPDFVNMVNRMTYPLNSLLPVLRVAEQLLKKWILTCSSLLKCSQNLPQSFNNSIL